MPEEYRLIATLDAPGGGNWQGVARNAKTGEWFLGHSRKRADGAPDDAIFYRFESSGKYRDKMVVPKAGHLYGFGVSESNILWFTWDTPRGNDVVTLSYRAGQTISDKSLASPMHTFSDYSTQVSFSPTRDYLVVAEFKPGQYAFTQRFKQDVLDNVDRPVGVEIVRPKSAGTLQGFSVCDGFLLLLYGAPEAKTWIEWWDFGTGNKTKTLDVTKAGTEAGAVAQREAEGMDGRLFCIKVQGGSARRMRVYELNTTYLASVKATRKKD